MTQASPLLEVEDLTTRFYTSRGVIGAVERLSLSEGHRHCRRIWFWKVGHSAFPLATCSGRGDRNKAARHLLPLSDQEMREVRRKHMIFQDPSNFLNPIMRIGDQNQMTAGNSQRKRWLAK